MERPPGLRRIRASSLSPELYGEISEFFSSVRPDLAISGRMSLYTIYNHLQGAKKKKISARQLKKAEEMIRALCAAVDLRFGTAAAPAEKKGRKAFPRAEQLPLEAIISEEIRKKFNSLGITDERAMKRVLNMLSVEEFSKRHATIVGVLQERAYRPLFSAMPDFLTSPRFNEALAMIQEKVQIIDRLSEGRGFPMGLDYTRDSDVLLMTFQQLSSLAKLNKILEKVRPKEMPPEEAAKYVEKFSDPMELLKFLEKIGFVAKLNLERTGFVCLRVNSEGSIIGAAQIQREPKVRYSITMISLILGEAGVSAADLKAAGVFQ